MSDLRPTLFLAQLSNLLAGNISIVHGVTGSSRTFMGEEAAGVDAVRIALARIAAGQSDLALVGGSHNGERRGPASALRCRRAHAARDVPAGLGARDRRRHGARLARAHSSCWRRASHAEARGAKPLARLSGGDVGAIEPACRAQSTAALARMWQSLASASPPDASR